MKVIVNDNMFRVKVCMTPETIQKGMMGQKFNSDFDGMLFMMPECGEQSFWMKNCITPLDIVFMDELQNITDISHNCPPCKTGDCDHYNGYGQYVLELEGGTCEKCGIEKGQKAKFTL